MQYSGNDKVAATHVVAASFAAFVAVAAAHYQRRKFKQAAVVRDPNLIPRLDKSGSGRGGRLESFSHYVARQMGFDDPANECPQLCKLAIDYLKKSEGCEDSIFEYFEKEGDVKSLYVKLIEEFERCILGYFAFHWSNATSMIDQVLRTESEERPKLKDFVFSATRKQRFERVTKDLKVTSVITTLVNEIRAIGGPVDGLMVPLAHNQRSPVLLFMGGGMGAGKSTVIKDILKEPFWAEASKNAVVVEADAFKETDVIYKALNSRGRHNDMLQTAELVHQSSTDAASSLLVTALNEGRDVIMDGTLSWEPFVQQTIAMARNVHKRRYRMGVGYKVSEDGTVTENYWEPVTEEQEKKVGHDNEENGGNINRKPYRIELVGVVCDAYMAVVRGIRRAVIMGRAVRVSSQLKSHQRFTRAFPRYCNLVDSARLYCTNAASDPPTLIARKDGESKLLVDTDEIKCLDTVSSLNPDAESIYELYADPNMIYELGSVWKDAILSPSRASNQLELKYVIQKIEGEKNETRES